MEGVSEKEVIAVVGPTNTGKTFYAVERMLGYKSGMIGFPLRLLAREVYDRLVKLRGSSSVALITGEERIIPPTAQYWMCTVEAMPVEIGVDFLAVDEIQLCGDQERGHIFTEKLLNARGRLETMFMGAETIKNNLSNLIPDLKVKKRDRFSKLSFTGYKKLSRIPPRSAIVTFSIEHVYALAELIRRQKGGAAVVMGALSPRTRNSQVSLYQNGDVDYLVATDAIGMGLNLDIKHVSFSRLSKFDGRNERSLFPNELAQIAGRAGRYTTDGTFGITGEADFFDLQVATAIENNRFSPLKTLQWRNNVLNYSSVASLIMSLEEKPRLSGLVRARESEDLASLKNLLEIPDVMTRVTNLYDVKLLWEVCKIPDFRKLSAIDHSTLLNKIFCFLSSDGIIPHHWLLEQVRRIDRIDGDIDTLSKRLAFIRTWTYVSYKRDWLADPKYWQGVTQAIEEKLSDVLHERLLQRFVDRRTSVLSRRLKQRENLVAEINDKSEIVVEGELIGKLVGFIFEPAKTESTGESRMLRSAALAVLGTQYSLRAERLYNSSDLDFRVSEKGEIFWRDTFVAKLKPGQDIFTPLVETVVDPEAGRDIVEKISRRIQHFVDRLIEHNFSALLSMKNDEQITGLARGISFQLAENLGVIPRDRVRKDIKALEQSDRALLRKHGIRFGQFTIYHHLMLKPAQTKLRLLLWSVFSKLDHVPEIPTPGLVTILAVENAGRPSGKPDRRC